MELPTELKSLYRHWNLHIQPCSGAKIFKDRKLESNICNFITERLNIWKRKALAEEPPYTKDPILAKYRFCNIFREFDKQTIEFHKLLNPLRDDFPLWLLNMFYCRMVARPETIEKVGLLSFNSSENKEVYKRLMNSPRPRFGTAYVFPISTIMRSTTPTRELFLTEYLPKIMHRIAREIEEWHEESVFNGVEKILPIFGYNLKFLWTETLIDVAYQYPDKINLFKQFPVGPGALPTIKKINNHLDPSLIVVELVKTNLETNITFNKQPLRLSAENWEGIGCEFRKYSNLKQNKGRKRLYAREG